MIYILADNKQITKHTNVFNNYKIIIKYYLLYVTFFEPSASILYIAVRIFACNKKKKQTPKLHNK